MLYFHFLSRDEYLSTFGESESKQQIEEKDRRRKKNINALNNT